VCHINNELFLQSPSILTAFICWRLPTEESLLCNKEDSSGEVGGAGFVSTDTDCGISIVIG
jgi:hypothetical protein